MALASCDDLEALVERLERAIDSLRDERDRLKGDVRDAEHEIEKLEAKIKVQELEAEGAAAAFQATLSKLQAYIAVNEAEAGAASARPERAAGPFSVG